MSDMGDMYRDIREHNRLQKANNDAWLIDRWLKSIEGSRWQKLSEHHWRYPFAGGAVDYWPTTSKAGYRGRYWHIAPDTLKKWMQHEYERVMPATSPLSDRTKEPNYEGDDAGLRRIIAQGIPRSKSAVQSAPSDNGEPVPFRVSAKPKRQAKRYNRRLANRKKHFGI